MKKTLLLFCMMSSYAQANNCLSVITNSKLVNERQESRETIRSFKNNFCQEYRRNESNNNTRALNASYKLFSGSINRGNSSTDELFQRYCRSESSQLDDERLFKEHIQTIAPAAYTAYESCLRFQQNDPVDFSLFRNMPTEFGIQIDYQPTNIGSKAQFEVMPSNGVNCNSGTNEQEVTNFELTYTNRSVVISCSRSDSNQQSEVGIVRRDQSASINLTWPRYVNDGNGDYVPVPELVNLNKKVAALETQIQEMNIQGEVTAFKTTTCPTGWELFEEAYGRVIRGIDPTGQIDVDRANLELNEKVASLQEDALQQHEHNTGSYDAGGGNKGAFRRMYNYGPPKPTEGIAEGARVSKTETRMKNVALLYCVKQ